jgi:hypothetical protein
MANLFKAARKDIRAVRRANNLDTMADFRATQNQVAAAFANASTTQAGLAKNLTRAQAREYAALQRIAGKGNAQSSLVNQRLTAKAVNRYGTALGPGIQQQMGVARAQEKATSNIGKSNVRAGKLLTEAGQTALGIQQSATAEAQASAEYATAVALKSRNQENAAQVAEMQFTLQQMRLDNKFAIQQMKLGAALGWKYKQKEIELMREIEEETGYEGIAASASIGSEAFPGLHAIYNMPLTEQDVAQLQEVGLVSVVGQRPNATEATNLYMLRNGITAGSNEALVIGSIARSMWGAGAGTNPGGLGEGTTGLYGVGTSDALRADLVEDAVIEGIISQYPQYADKTTELRAAIHAGVVSDVTRQTMDFTAKVVNEVERNEGQTQEEQYNAMTHEEAQAHVKTIDSLEDKKVFMGAWLAAQKPDGILGAVTGFLEEWGPEIAGAVIGTIVGIGPVAGAAIGGGIQGGVEAFNADAGPVGVLTATAGGAAQGALVGSLPLAAKAAAARIIPAVAKVLPAIGRAAGWKLGTKETATVIKGALTAESEAFVNVSGRVAGTKAFWSIENLVTTQTVQKVAAALGRDPAEVAELLRAASKGSEFAIARLKELAAAAEI